MPRLFRVRRPDIVASVCDIMARPKKNLKINDPILGQREHECIETFNSQIKMKNRLKNSLFVTAILAASVAAFAAKEKKPSYDLPTYTVEDIATLPEPTYNPIPTISSRYVGLDLQVKFTVNAQGRAESVRLVKPLASYSDVHKMTFANQIQEQVKYWKFEPALDTQGNPIEVNVIMPVQVVEKRGSVKALASLKLDEPFKDRS